MRFTWLWITCYFAWACISHWNSEEPHSIGDLLLVVLLLCAVNLFAVGRKCATTSSLKAL